jgi:hypothetical protein
MGTPISQLTEDIRPDEDYIIPVAYSGANYRVQLKNLMNFQDGTGTNGISVMYVRNTVFRFGAGCDSSDSEDVALADGAPILYVDNGLNLNFRKINSQGYARIYIQNSSKDAQGASIGIAAARSPLNGYIGFRYSNRTSNPIDGRLSCEILNSNVKSSQVTMQWQCDQNRFIMTALYYPENPNSSAGSNGVQVSTSNGQDYGGLVGTYLYPKITSSTNSATVIQERALVPSYTNNTGITMNLGDADNIWKNVYATNGTIQTSDKNLKQDISSLEDAERKVAFKLKDMVKKFRWIESVEKKGEDARIHVGFIAQEVEQAFSEEGLDARRYSLFCVDKIYEVFRDGVSLNRTQAQNEWFVTEDENETDEGITYVEKEKYSLRLDQVLAFVISAL